MVIIHAIFSGCALYLISQKKKKGVSTVKHVFNVRVNVLEFLRVKGVSFKSRVEQEFQSSCVRNLFVFVL